MGTIFMNRENSKMNEPHKFILNLSRRSKLISSDEHVAPQNLSIYFIYCIGKKNSVKTINKEL